MARGFVYLVAVIDWYSRRVHSWRLSDTLDSQFTSEGFIAVLKLEEIQISMAAVVVQINGVLFGEQPPGSGCGEMTGILLNNLAARPLHTVVIL